ncbi:MAG: hypothetical protein JWQ34_2707 [Mucilaginibacter sp.]|uniref:hypothetical protein n=1 Tax=Mucilaginibacter sp. TaxID=1882438 RepID=UPI00263082E7|nr:hypothetical protein [Mucilaginibacter sp.]MDB5004482.1 hypothetical protein [Mucilaginibacter sp.]
MKKIFISSTLALAIFAFGCKKSSISTPVTADSELTPANYDLKKSIFRVIVTDQNSSFNVSVTTTNAAHPSHNSIQQGNQGAGTTFEYPFTPMIGDSIKVVAKGASGPINLYPSYKSTQVGPVTTLVNAAGTTVTFNYLVKD